MRSFGSWKRRIFFLTGVLAALASLGGVTAAPAAATNGCGCVVFRDGFETPTVPPPLGNFLRFYAGQQMGAWTVTRDNVDLAGQGSWQTVEGVQSLELNGDTNGAVAVNFPTVPLFKYRVSYALAGDPVGGPTIKTGQVLVNGNVAQSFSFDITGKTRGNMGWVRKSFVFLSLGHSATLEFAGTNPGDFGPVIDDVVVEKCLLILC
jgi:choice-of-anchor C domain-containing protein